jgi:diguanylate cyclase (GGDEF)-like protein/PAS domain S-box-containing protein
MTEPSASNAVFAEQVRHLYRLSRHGYAGTLINAGVLTLVLWDLVVTPLLVAWAAAIVVVIGARYALYRAYFRAPRPPEEAPVWARRFVIGATVTGMLWGFVGSALFPTSSMPHQFLVIFLIGGMVISAMVVLAPLRQAFLAYMVPAMALVTGTVLAQGTQLHLFMGVLLIVFMAVMLGTGPVLTEMMRESLRIKYENAVLVERASQANRELSEHMRAQQRVEESLRQSEQRYRCMFDANPMPMWIRDEETLKIQAVNAAALNTYGYTPEEFLRLKSTDLLVPEDLARFAHATTTRDPGLPYTGQWRHQRKNGSLLDVETTSYPFELEGRPSRLLLVQDITERNREERRRNLETVITVLLADARTIEEVMPRVVRTLCESLDYAYGARWVLDAKERVLRCAESWSVNDAAIDEFRRTNADHVEIPGKPGGLNRRVWATSAPVWLADVTLDPTLAQAEVAARAGLRTALAFPILVGGEFYGVMEFFGRSVRPRDDEAIELVQTVGSQIGQFIGRKLAENNLQFFASHDSLTGLFNRTMFAERLQQALAQAQRHERALALLFIDLDGFKVINDTLGHNAGDAFLIEIAARLRSILREGDVIARIGGDEFVVLIEEFADATHAAEVAKKILETVSKPFVVQNREFSVTASIGVAVYPEDGEETQQLLKSADIAMYRAKEGGKNGYRFSAQEMNVHLIERLSLESGLRRALERDELKLLYQPKVSIATGSVTGIEALVRWQHPAQGMISPSEFVPIAEDTGLINAIGGWVLHTACEQARAWQDQGVPYQRIAVNLSARQFSQDNLLQVVREALHRVGLDAGRLELEITEGMVIRNPERAVKALVQLRELGVRVTLDDFGTGYSSLGYLMRCPVDAIKLDRSFVLKLPADAESATIARAVIAMAHSMRLHVIAEGVETREQWEFLRDLGCDEMQGNYFSEPVIAGLVPGFLHPSGTGRRASVQVLYPKRESGGDKQEG